MCDSEIKPLEGVGHMTGQISLPPLPPPYRHGGTYESAPFDYFSDLHMRNYGEACARAALEAAAQLAHGADKSTHPADLADAIRALEIGK